MNSAEVKKIIGRGRNVHVVGIKGAGVAGLVQILKAKGFHVSGSDTHEKFFTDEILKRAGIPYHEGFSAKNIASDTDWALASNAYLGEPITNPEILELKKRKISILSYPQALSHFFNTSYGIAISGTHGKTTVSAIVAFILNYAGKEPNALIGSEVINWKSNAIVGESDIFVLEADEYREQFLEYKPHIIAILNTDWDHPDYFKTHEAYKEAFEKFKENLQEGGKIFTFVDFNEPKIKFETKLIGEHNQFNLNAAHQICRHLGIEESVIRRAIAEFEGTVRRLQVVGKYKGSIVVDDYGHNPQKVAAGLKALKAHYPDRDIVVVFQPHTFSRTEAFVKEFAEALTLADDIYLLDVYASAREARGTTTSENIREEIKKLGRHAINLETVSEAVKFFHNTPPKNSVIVAMGAGNVGDLAEALTKEK